MTHNDSSNGQNDDMPGFDNFVLETPPSADNPEVEPLFAEETLALVVAKVSVYEAMLGLLVKNLRFTDFTREILLIVMRVMKSEAGSLLEVDHRNRTLFFRAAVGQSSDRITGFVVPMGQGIVGHVAESRQTMVISKVSENRIHLKAIEKAVGFEARNMVAVPIIIRGKVYGVIQLLNRVGADCYSDSDVDLLIAICEVTAKILEIRLMLSAALRGRLVSGEGGMAVTPSRRGAAA